MTQLSREFLLAIPKTDLHVHLDGSLRLSTLIDLAKAAKIEMPSMTEDGLKKLVFKDRYNDLPEYLHGFKYTVASMQTPESLEQVAYELALDNYEEGVCYIEVRFAPQLHINEKMDLDTVLESVDKGFCRAKKEINTSTAVTNGDKMAFEYGIIGCAMRMFTAGFSDYYRKLTELHSLLPQKELFAMASLDLVRALVKARDEKGLAIVGFDLAGAEKGNPAEDHKSAYDYAHRHFMKKTVHAGEAFGPSSIFQAITTCHADRIGHGTNLFNANMINHPDNEAKQLYVEGLSKYIADQRITIEVCLTSNLQTMPELTDLHDHPFQKMLDARLSTTFCTDNRLISHTTMTDEIEKADCCR